MAEPKKDPYALGPNNKLVIIAGICMVIGISWFCWEAFLRELTPEEKKNIRDEIEEQKRQERERKKHPGAH